MSGRGKPRRDGITLVQLMDMFPTEAAAREWFEQARWCPQRVCPHCCGSRTNVVRSGKPMPYHCPDCRKYFSVKTGTVMQSSKLPLRKWAVGIYLMSTSLKGVSSMKLRRDLGITQKTAWMMAQKIRQGWIEGSTGPISGSLEVDETHMGGKERNKHASKTLNAGRGTVRKSPVVGAKLRRGKVVAEHVQHVDRPPLKRCHKGVYPKMTPKHLMRYIAEFAGRHDFRDLDTLEQMIVLARGMDGRLLPWKKLTA